ncbi:MAG: 30S ribosomal protein S16 [Deltaproteobacteria bacterium]
MATTIRLARHGSKKRPFYRIVAATTKAPRDGRFLEQLGHYDPTREPVELRVHLDKVEKWIRNGAKPSDTVASLLKKAGWKGLPPATASSPASAEG